MRTQTFENGEIGLSIRNKLNSITNWNSSYSYGSDDITHYSGSIYTSISDSNVGLVPVSSVQWKNLSSSSSLSTTSSYTLSSSYAESALSASWASNSLSSSYFNQLWLSTGSTYPITSSWSNNSQTASYLIEPVIFDAYTNNNQVVTIRNRYDGQSTTAQLMLAIPSVSGSIKASDGTGQDQDVPNIIINSTTGIVTTINDSPIVEINLTGMIPYGEGNLALGSATNKWTNLYVNTVTVSNITSSTITASLLSVVTGSGIPSDTVTIKAWLPIQFASEKYYMPLYQ